MLASIGILLISTLIFFREAPALKKKSLKRELFSFVALLLLGTGVSIGKALRLNIPNPLDWISLIFTPFSKLLSEALK